MVPSTASACGTSNGGSIGKSRQRPPPEWDARNRTSKRTCARTAATRCARHVASRGEKDADEEEGDELGRDAERRPTHRRPGPAVSDAWTRARCQATGPASSPPARGFLPLSLPRASLCRGAGAQGTPLVPNDYLGRVINRRRQRHRPDLAAAARAF